MALIVQKFGGTSVGTIERIKTVASHIQQTVQQGHRVVAVVSAMGSQTDDLLDLAFAISPQPPAREVDMLLTVGERITMSLLSMALHELQISSQSLTGSQSGILTDHHHGNARIEKILGDRVRDALSNRQVVIVAGFQGMSPASKEITTLGRGGSDLTALALAHCLHTDSCVIYKDVDGICTADPRLAPAARVLPALSWNALLELTWCGAGVVHARAAHLAKKFSIPLEIRSSFNFNHPGTRIEGANVMESPQVIALAHKDQQTFLSLRTAGSLSLLPESLTWLWQKGESPLMVQELRDTDGCTINQIMSSTLTAGLKDHLTAYLQQKNARLVTLAERSGLATISVIGEGFSQSPETVAKVLQALPTEPVFLETKNTAINLGLPETALESSIKSLHTTLFEAH